MPCFTMIFTVGSGVKQQIGDTDVQIIFHLLTLYTFLIYFARFVSVYFTKQKVFYLFFPHQNNSSPFLSDTETFCYRNAAFQNPVNS